MEGEILGKGVAGGVESWYDERKQMFDKEGAIEWNNYRYLGIVVI